jgi:hypothetical protein
MRNATNFEKLLYIPHYNDIANPQITPQGCFAPRGGFDLDRWFMVWRGLGKRIKGKSGYACRIYR